MDTLSTMKWVYLKYFFIFYITKEMEKQLKNFIRTSKLVYCLTFS